VVMLTLTGP